MGEVGRWDENLFARFAEVAALPRPMTRAEDAQHRGLLGELARTNDRLAIKMLPQYVRRVPGADRLERDDALSAARIALVRAFESFDAARGTPFSSWFKFALRDELQRAAQYVPVVVRGRHQPHAPVVFFEDDGELADQVEEESAFELADPSFASEPAARLRSALDIFLEEHLRFARTARAAASALLGRYEHVARTYGHVGVRDELVEALLARGARTTSLRVPWSPSPVRGFAGVCLQSDIGGEARK